MKHAILLALVVLSTVLSLRSVRLQADREARLQADPQTPKIQPTPRLSDGKPDLTGVYQASNRRGPEWDAQVPGDVPGQPAQSTQPSAAVNVAQREPIPFRPEALQRAQEILNRRSVDDPASIYYMQPQWTTVLRKDIQGFVFNPIYIGTYDFYKLRRKA